MLLPPVTPVVVQVPKARQFVPRQDCNLTGSVITMEWKGKTALFKLAPPKELADDQNRPYTAATKALDDFRNSLETGSEKGCYDPDESKRLLGVAAEHFPLPSIAAFGLRYGAYAQSGYVDVTPEFHLEVISPIANGFETAAYSISQGRLHLLTVNGVAATQSVSQDWLKFPDVALQYRLIFLISKSSADHDAILLGAPNRDALERATELVQAQPEDACAARGANYVCSLAPARSAINPQFQVLANGQPAYIALSGTVRELINPKGPRMMEPPSSLKVKRFYEGQRIPIQYDGPEILSLVLLPGDELVW